MLRVSTAAVYAALSFGLVYIARCGEMSEELSGVPKTEKKLTQAERGEGIHKPFEKMKWEFNESDPVHLAKRNASVAKQTEEQKIYREWMDQQLSFVCGAREMGKGSQCDLMDQRFQGSTKVIPLSSAAEVQLRDSVYTRMKLRQALGDHANLIHIGANTLTDDEVTYYQALLDQGPWNLTFLEPQTQLIPKLRENVARLTRPESASIINKALCPVALDTLEMYRMKDEIAQAHPDIDFTQTASLDVNWHSNWKFHSVEAYKSILMNKTADEIAEMQVSEDVECVTVKGLIADLDYDDAGSWDVVILDSQGGDSKILNMFMDVGGFGPAAVMFKWTGFDHNEESTKTYDSGVRRIVKAVQRLAKAGYDVHKSENVITAINRKSV